MTSLWEFGEPEPIEASHLLRVRCTGRGGACGAETLAAPGRERDARCAACWGGSVVVPGLAGRYAPVVGHALRRATREVGPNEAESPYPAAVVTSREPYAGPWPAAVERIAAFARSLEWDVEMTYSRGCPPHGATGAPLAARDVFVVRCRRPGWGAYASHDGGKWDSVMLWGTTLPWFPLGNVTNLREFLIEPARDSAWFDVIRERERLKKVRAAARPKAVSRDREGLR